MRYSQLPFKTSKTISSELVSKNAKLLTKAGYIHQEIAGVYTFLPLGLRVLNKIENIVREEMDKIGVEVLMSSLAPVDNWEKTGRGKTNDVLMKTTPANTYAKEKNDTEYILGPTHEEIVTPLVLKYAKSYKDFPVAVYQIQTKFRNEPRAKSGLLRCREFRMKDLYSFHISEEDLKAYYERVKESYWNVFERLGLGRNTSFLTLASGGDFTTDYSHEFQTICDAGEDTIFHVKSKNLTFNREIAPTQTGEIAKEGDLYPETGEKYEVYKAAEIGNIFPLYTKFTKAFGFSYRDERGQQQPIYMGCYGIGPSRIMGVLVEKFADEKGLVWPENVAPFQVHLIEISNFKFQISNFQKNTHVIANPSPSGESVKPARYASASVAGGQSRKDKRDTRGEEIYEALTNSDIEVFYDDRDISAGEKFNDADLLGIPVRLVISPKTGDKIEWKKRTEDKTELLTIQEVIKRLQK